MSTESTVTGGTRHTVAAAPSNVGWWPKRLNLKILIGLLAASFAGAFMFKGAPFITSVQSQVLIKSANIDQTLVIAEQELKKGDLARLSHSGAFVTRFTRKLRHRRSRAFISDTSTP